MPSYRDRVELIGYRKADSTPSGVARTVAHRQRYVAIVVEYKDIGARCSGHRSGRSFGEPAGGKGN
jgi:hypothetical protein